MPDPLALDLDAMSIYWRGMLGYAFLPYILIGRVLEKGAVDQPCESVQLSLKERGFSDKAAEQITRGRRQSSRAVYEAM